MTMGANISVLVSSTFINVELGCEEQVQRDLKKVEWVKDVYTSYGVYDFIVKVASESPGHLQKLVFDNLRKIENLKSTLTLIVSEDNTVRHKTVEKHV
jgi:DNA-binding Lrp family transcriptional regulator